MDLKKILKISLLPSLPMRKKVAKIQGKFNFPFLGRGLEKYDNSPFELYQFLLKLT